MFKSSNVFTRVKCYVSSDLRQNKRRYFIGLLCFLLGIVLAVIFTCSGDLGDAEHHAIIGEILRGRGILYSYLCFLPSFLLLIVLTTIIASSEKLSFIFYVILVLQSRKIFVNGIFLILHFGIWGVVDFIVYFAVLYTLFIFCIIFYFNSARLAIGEYSCCKRRNEKFEIIKELIFLALPILLMQILAHTCIYLLLKLLF